MWYVVQVLAGKEQAALESIERLVDHSSYDEAFIPQREVMRHRSQGWVRERETLFPGYLFVETRHPNDFATGLPSVPEFTRMLGSDAGYTPLSNGEKELIESFMGAEHVVGMSEGIIVGSEIRILQGPLRDHDAVIKKIDRHRRSAIVRMSIMGREVDVTLGLEIVRKVD